MALGLAFVAVFLAGGVTVLWVQHVMTRRRGRQIDELVRRVADANPRTGLGL